MNKNKEVLLFTLSAATFIIFFQIYMVAPLIPELSGYFGVSEQKTGLIVPAFLIPYGLSSLFYGLLSDRLGTKRIILLSFFLFSLLIAGSALSKTINELILWRLFAGVGASGVIPISLAWIGEAYPYEKRGRPIGFIFGAVAGGGAFGAFAGALLESYLGWRGLFLSVGALALLIWVGNLLAYQRIEMVASKTVLRVREVFNGYKELLLQKRGGRTYLYVMLNGIFTSGVYTWLALYLDQNYALGGRQIAFALLGYGIPGLVLGPVIGKMADRYGRSRLLPIGFLTGSLSAFLLIFNIPLTLSRVSIIALSLGFDLTQPLLAGIVSQVGRGKGGQAMSVMAFMLFVGFGLGSYLFGLGLHLGMKEALIIFSSFQFLLALFAVPVFRQERF